MAFIEPTLNGVVDARSMSVGRRCGCKRQEAGEKDSEAMAASSTPSRHWTLVAQAKLQSINLKLLSVTVSWWGIGYCRGPPEKRPNFYPCVFPLPVRGPAFRCRCLQQMLDACPRLRDCSLPSARNC